MEKGKDLEPRKFKPRKKEDPQLIFGRRAVLEAFHANKTVEKLFIQKDLKGDLIKELKDYVRQTKTSLSLVPQEKLKRFTLKNHQGVVGFLSLIEYSSLHHEIAACYENGINPLVTVLDEVTDVRNIGSIARSAECAGVNAIVLPSKGSGQINSDAMKASAGALNHIAVCREHNLFETCRYLKDSGLQILACTEKGSKNYYEVDFTTPTVLIMGSEDEGISNQLLKIADQEIRIPMVGKIGSLNVSNATSILLFEALRQRNQSK